MSIYAKWIEQDQRFSFSTDDNGGFELSFEEHAFLLAGQSAKKIIRPDADGRPALLGAPAPPPATRADIEAARLRAYAAPLTGSDRYFAEAQRESLLGNADAADAAKALGMARFAEIQAEYPWPAE
jgi:hypothetical protein